MCIHFKVLIGFNNPPSNIFQLLKSLSNIKSFQAMHTLSSITGLDWRRFYKWWDSLVPTLHSHLKSNVDRKINVICISCFAALSYLRVILMMTHHTLFKHTGICTKSYSHLIQKHAQVVFLVGRGEGWNRSESLWGHAQKQDNVVISCSCHTYYR